MAIKRCLAELSNKSKPIVASKLISLSNLSTEELKLFINLWERIEAKRRRQIIQQLAFVTMNNIKLNFDNIFKACLQDPDAIVRVKAIEGLWECEDCVLVRSLIEMLAKDNEEVVRAAAATALGKFALLAELQKMPPRYIAKISGALLSVIEDKREKTKVRCGAIEAIAPLSLPEVKEIIHQAYNSKEIKLKVSALRAMGRNCDPKWLPILLHELSSSIAEMRIEAAKACGELGEAEVEPYLVKLTKDAEVQVRLAAMEALGKVGGTEAERALRQCLYDANGQIRQRAQKAMQKLGLREDFHLFWN